jgi:divalent metal cation (Fe/Co/Zn/Cd) transporter
MNEAATGEQRLKLRSRRWWQILLAAGAAGLIPGFLLGYSSEGDLFALTTVWPAWIAILLAVTFLVAVSVTSWMLYRQVDEHQRQACGKAAILAAGIVIILYPVWFMLWMGEILPEPSHWVIFLTLYITYAVGSLYYRYR